METILKLTKDLKGAAKLLSLSEVRYLVDLYYQIQDYRKSAANQNLSMREEPTELLRHFESEFRKLEANIKIALEIYTDNHEIGVWAKGIVGIGPIISAGLLSHVDIKKAPTVGHIWAFAGLDPLRKWLSKDEAKALVKEVRKEIGNNVEAVAVEVAQRLHMKPASLIKQATHDKDDNPIDMTWDTLRAATAKRPWNASLKTLCWKIGESFVKVSGKEDDIYGKYYLERKQYEIRKNEQGDYRDQALAMAKKRPNHKQIATYKAGRLPDGQIHSRAKRWTVKLFLSHFHEQYYRYHFGSEPPKPYPIAILGHAHKN